MFEIKVEASGNTAEDIIDVLEMIVQLVIPGLADGREIGHSSERYQFNYTLKEVVG